MVGEIISESWATSIGIRNENHPTALRLKELGVTYGSEGKGRGAKSFLLKAA